MSQFADNSVHTARCMGALNAHNLANINVIRTAKIKLKYKGFYLEDRYIDRYPKLGYSIYHK